MSPQKFKTSSILHVIAFLLVIGFYNFGSNDDADQVGRTNNIFFISLWISFYMLSSYRALSRLSRPMVRLDLTFTLWALIPILSIMWSHDSFYTAFYGISFFMSALFGWELYLLYGPDRLIRYLYLTLKVAAIVTIVLLLTYPSAVIYNDYLQRDSLLGLPPIKGLFDHKLTAAIWFSIAFLMSLSLERGGLGKIAWAAVFSAFTLATASSQGPVLLLLLGALYLVKSGLNRVHLVALLFMCFLIGLVLPFLSESSMAGFAAIVDRDAGLTGRGAIWSSTIHAMSESPVFGFGYEALFRNGRLFDTYFPNMIYYRPPHAHNSYLQAISSFGVFFAFFYFSLLAYIFWRFVSHLTRPNYPRARVVILSGILICYSVCASLENTLMGYAGFFNVLMGAIAAAGSVRNAYAS